MSLEVTSDVKAVASMVFASFNKDGNDYIDVEELKLALRVDTDNDGKITHKLQTRTLPNGRTTTWKETDMLKRALDRYKDTEKQYGNGDGKITMKELEQMLMSGSL